MNQDIIKKLNTNIKENPVTIYTTCKIDVAHFLYDYDGKCANPHGHTMKVEVWLSGNINKETGMLVDFAKVKSIIESLDHTYLNDLLDFNPTAENLAVTLARTIHSLDENINNTTVRVWETENGYAETYIE